MKSIAKRVFSVVIAVIILFSCQPAFANCSVPIQADIALIHFNPTLGDKSANINSLETLISQSLSQGADIVVTPELATSGYCLTREQVINGLGIAAPYNELNDIKDLANQYNAYIFVGFPEISGTAVYNSVVCFGPNNFMELQRKRAKSEWHDVGNLSFDVIPTPYGDLGPLICSDSYLPDFSRILAMNGADIIISPANWWGEGTQVDIWKTNAHDNNVWLFVSNRWGQELDTRYNPSYLYDMNDSPTAVVDPKGEVKLVYKTMDDSVKENKILHYTSTVPSDRIGNAVTSSYSLNYRRPTAYQQIGNAYYNPDSGNTPVPGLPTAGTTSYSALSYKQSDYFTSNYQAIVNIFVNNNLKGTGAVVAPDLGLGSFVVNEDANWRNTCKILKMQKLIDNFDIGLFTTTVNTISLGKNYKSLLIFQKGKLPILSKQLHDRGNVIGSGYEPLYIDLNNTRVGIVSGTDFNFPEVSTALAKVGCDTVLVSGSLYNETSTAADNYYWNIDGIKSLIKTRVNHCFHIVMADNMFGAIAQSKWGSLNTFDYLNTNYSSVSKQLDSNDTRDKYLNRYNKKDLDVLIGLNQ